MTAKISNNWRNNIILHTHTHTRWLAQRADSFSIERNSHHTKPAWLVNLSDLCCKLQAGCSIFLLQADLAANVVFPCQMIKNDNKSSGKKCQCSRSFSKNDFVEFWVHFYLIFFPWKVNVSWEIILSRQCFCTLVEHLGREIFTQ